MPDSLPKPSGIYRFSSIARPVDPRYPTNRALLVLLPLLALASAGLTIVLELDGGALSKGLGTMLTCFVAWALTRELSPDDDVAAFVAVALAWSALLFLDATSVLLPFVALLLVRIVNRSTGLPARPFDTISILGVCIWAAISLEQGLILLLAAVAFSLNATLTDPQRHHFLAAGACLTVFAWLLIEAPSFISFELPSLDWLIVITLAAAYVWAGKQYRAPMSVSDVYSKRLDPVRVRGGLLLGFLLAVQALLTDGRTAWSDTPIWACVIAVPVSLLARRRLAIVN